MSYELVVRKHPRLTIYLRRSPDRSVETTSRGRLETLLAFAHAANRSYGQSYEQMIANVQEDMALKPPSIPKPREITVSMQDLVNLQVQMIKKGITTLPSYRIEVKPKVEVPKKIPEVI